MLPDAFHPLIVEWFQQRFGAPTAIQDRGWPAILDGGDVLLSAPTGSGKTLSAFLVCLDQLVRLGLRRRLGESVYAVYVSPLRALSNDMQRNLDTPLAELRQLAHDRGVPLPAIRTAVRTGDTPAADRQAMLRKPPHILVTTPESLYLMLTSPRSRSLLAHVQTVIVDEIHALARDKRGSHLALSLERLDVLCADKMAKIDRAADRHVATLFDNDDAAREITRTRPQRIGLSATQRPLDAIARFLIGSEPQRTCTTIDMGCSRELDLAVEVPPDELESVCSHETWQQVYGRLAELIRSHRSTLVFVNTRRLAERVTHQLTALLGEDAVASHHGSLSQPIRHSTERRLKSGQLKAVVATASLELGIDIGHLDLVCQIGSPRALATFLQRIGRSGHALGVIPKGRLFALTRDELLECLALTTAVRQGLLDRIEIPEGPLDILAQQIVAEVAGRDWDADELFAVVRRATPFRNVSREAFDSVVEMLAEGIRHGRGRSTRYLHYDRIHGRLRARANARLVAITCGGAIPDNADYRVVTEGDRTFVGTVDEDFAIESMAGDVFLLGNTSWRIRHVRGGEVTVVDAGGAPPTIPFWRGEAPGRTAELSAAVSWLRRELADRADDVSQARDWLRERASIDEWGASQAVNYVAAQRAALGRVPTQDWVIFERFFDEAGGMQLVIHAPFGTRKNRAWGLALRKCFCRTFNFELQASADDDGIVLSLGPQHSFALERMFRLVTADNLRHLLEQAILAAPMFNVRWRWNATRALAVRRQRGGKRMPPHLQRMYADDLIAAVFPQAAACLENVVGDIEIPDHPLVQQTVHDCFHEAMDLDGMIELFRRVQLDSPEPASPADRDLASMVDAAVPEAVRFVGCDTREPSPFAYERLNANPYAFLDDAPLEERRARAVATRRSLTVESVTDLGRLDPEAIRRVCEEAWPAVRNADELHDALWTLGALPADRSPEWSPKFRELVADGRAAVVALPAADSHANGSSSPKELWITAERWPMIRAALRDVHVRPQPRLPAAVDIEWSAADARVTLLRGWMECVGPTRERELSSTFGLDTGTIHTILEALEAEGCVLRGRFTPSGRENGDVEWCDRRLLARIHRLTLDGLRRQIEPVSVSTLMRFLIRHQHMHPDTQLRGPAGLLDVVEQLQGFEAPAAAWERSLLRGRISDYRPNDLDAITLAGQVAWGRLRPPRPRDDDNAAFATLTRVLPISLFVRDDGDWLVDLFAPRESPAPQNGNGSARPLSSRAEQVRRTLQTRGALFWSDLLKRTDLLPAEAESVVGELVAAGYVTSDGFAALRNLITPESERRRMRSRLRGRAARTGRRADTGRWALLPWVEPDVDNDAAATGASTHANQIERTEKWARQLLARYGVLFRELLTRESSAPPWREIVPLLRRLEARGDIRGGRFVAEVSGEQYAVPASIGRLRRLRDEPPEGEMVVISAADPLNLAGILTSDARVQSVAGNALVYCDGRLAGFRQAKEITISHELPPRVAQEVRAALTQSGGTRLPVQNVTDSAEPTMAAP